MNRRTFVTAGAAAFAAPAPGLEGRPRGGPAGEGQAGGKLLAKLGMQDYASDDFLQIYSAFGIETRSGLSRGC
jgi:hypothetical protein